VVVGEVDAIKQDLSELRNEMRESYSGLRSDLKELAKALRELIRLDGDIGRVADLAQRIGKEVDDLAALMRADRQELDKRLRTLEQAQVGNSKSAGLVDWLVRHTLSMAIGAAFGAAVIKGMS
jgi:chromosome segregation ATPase